MSARDELADIIASNRNEYADKTADRILTAGYQKRRTITTAEELDALPVGSVLIDRDHDICQRFRGGWRATIHEPNDDPWLTDSLEVDLPATVLHEPQP